MNARYRPILFAAAGIVVIWLLAWGGFTIARNSKMTADKLRAYIEKIDFGKLTGDARKKALRELADKLNSLSAEERRRARLEGLVRAWFDQMTEEEKAEFIELTMPTGFRQMINAFEKLPEEKRKKVVNDAMKRLREARENGEGVPQRRGKNEPPLSPELEKKVTTIGLKTFYSQSSAQTKAELAPLMEEIQRSMQTGRMLR